MLEKAALLVSPNYKVVVFHGRCCLGNAKRNGNLICYLDF